MKIFTQSVCAATVKICAAGSEHIFWACGCFWKYFFFFFKERAAASEKKKCATASERKCAAAS